MRAWPIVLGLFVFGGATALLWADFGYVPTIYLALFGWLRFLRDTLPQIRLNGPSTAVGSAATVAFLIGSHFFLKSLVRAAGSEASEPTATARTWRWQWSAAVLGILLVMFVAGTSMIGLVHQLVWIAMSPEPKYEELLADSFPGNSRNRLKQVGMGISNYNDTYNVLPESGKGVSNHSWITQIAPFVAWTDDSLDLEKPWNHPDNAPVMRKLNPTTLNPQLPKGTWRDADGWGLSHYAANQHVIGPQGVRTPSEIEDGASQTLLVGEVNANFSPWGRPGNCREPALGLNRSPHGFGAVRGSPDVCFLMADGSIRELSQNIDPAVLKALASPAGGDETNARPQ